MLNVHQLSIILCIKYNINCVVAQYLFNYEYSKQEYYKNLKETYKVYSLLYLRKLKKNFYYILTFN